MDECIEREVAIEAIYERCTGEHWEDILRSIPPADVRPVVRSRWQISCDGWYPYCPVCGAEPPGREMTPFCPMCRADMRGGEERT